MSGVRLFGVGDVFPNVPDGRAAFRHLAPLLGSADVVVGNCEGVYSDHPAPAPSHKHMMVTATERASSLREAGFHVLSLGNNHMMDGGYAGLDDTRAVLKAQGILTTGAGENLAQALQPAVVERNGLRIAFLAFCSVFPVGYEAREGRPGISALRVRTLYHDPDRNFWEPGIDPLVITEPVPEDLERCRSAVRAAKAEADVVVALCHWGYSSRLESLQSYEVELAHDIVDHGADIVLCCHHHSLRGVEVYGGRPIFYGLGTLVHHLSTLYPPSAEELARRRARFGEKAHVPTSDFPLFPFHPDARMTGIATFDLAPGGSIAAGFIPAEILADGSTEPLRPDDGRGTRVLDYLARITAESGFATEFSSGESDGYRWAAVRGTGVPSADGGATGSKVGAGTR